MKHGSAILISVSCLVHEDRAYTRLQDAIVATAAVLTGIDDVYDLIVLVDHRIGVRGLQTARQEQLLHFHCMQICIRSVGSF